MWQYTNAYLIVDPFLGYCFSPISPIPQFTLQYLFSCADGAFQLWERNYTPGLAYILQHLLGLVLPPTTEQDLICLLRGYQHGGFIDDPGPGAM